MRKTIITSSNKISEIQQLMLKNEAVDVGTHVLPFNAYFYNVTTNQDLEALQQYDTLQTIKENLIEFKDLIASPKIFKDFTRFVKELHGYGLSLDDLPEEKTTDKDIKKILRTLHTDINPIKTGFSFYKEGLLHHQYTYLKNNGALERSFKKIESPIIHKRKALNFRQEVESVVQDIVKKSHDGSGYESFSIVTPNLKKDAPFIEASLKRYGYEVSYFDYGFDIVKHQFLTLLMYIEKPSVDTLLLLLENNVFKLKEAHNILYYINHFKLDLNKILEPFVESLDLLPLDNGRTFGDEIVAIQNLIREDLALLQEKLTLLHEATLQDALVIAVETISNYNKQASKPIFRYIQNIILGVHERNIAFVKEHIQSMKPAFIQDSYIKLYDLNSFPGEPVEVCYVLGLTAKNFPGIASNSGLLDEDYRARIKGYPSQTTRVQYDIEQKESLFNKAKTLYLSSHEITFEGKSQEVSVSLPDGKVTAWTLQEPDVFMKLTKALSPDIAHGLYLKNQMISGSVSSFEMYAKDPYAYFIQYGLKIREPFVFGFNNMFFGSLYHEVLNQSIQNNQFEFDAFWHKYKPYFASNDTFIQFLIQKAKDLIEFHFDNLQSIQEASELTVEKFETVIHDAQIFEGIQFSGIIDRIDTYTSNSDTGHSIVDYKSTDTAFSMPDIMSGKQLQLLTYAVLLASLKEKPVYGVFYYGLDKKSPSGTGTAYNYTQTKGIQDPIPVSNQAFVQLHKFKGAVFNTCPISFSKTHYSFGKYHLEETENFIVHMFSLIKENILNGVIDKNILNIDLSKDYDLKRKDD